VVIVAGVVVTHHSTRHLGSGKGRRRLGGNGGVGRGDRRLCTYWLTDDDELRCVAWGTPELGG
jgi:hypothetical protein